MTCIFCKIIKNQIPSFKIYEDNHVVAFLDISQTTKGHTLVIPKEHSENILDIEDNEIDKALLGSIRIISNKLRKSLECKGFNIVSNIDEKAGQTIFHTHIHIIPRYGQNDGFEQNYMINEPNFEKLEQLQKKIMEVV